MTSLVACLGTTKGTLAYIQKLIDAEPWEKIFLVSDESGLSFSPGKPVSFIVVKEDLLLSEMVELIKKQIENRVPDTEVALNLISGSGKLHMAILSALMKSGLGIRLVGMSKDGMKEI